MSTVMPSPEIMPVFASTKIILHSDEFVIVSLPLSQKERACEMFKQLDPFSSITVDHTEVSLILRTSDWGFINRLFKSSQVEGPYRAITFDIILDLNLVGYLSVVSEVLAEAGISIFAMSTFLRDHILIKSSQADDAVHELESLIHRCCTQ